MDGRHAGSVATQDRQGGEALVVPLSLELRAAVHERHREPPTAAAQDGSGLEVGDQRFFRDGGAPPEDVEVAVKKGAVGHVSLVGPDEEVCLPAPLERHRSRPSEGSGPVVAPCRGGRRRRQGRDVVRSVEVLAERPGGLEVVAVARVPSREAAGHAVQDALHPARGVRLPGQPSAL